MSYFSGFRQVNFQSPGCPMFYRLLITAASTALFCACVSADDSEAAVKFTKYAKQMASEYTIESADRLLELDETPVLTWTDPENGEIYGAVFVWTDAGRPATIASIYKWYRPYTHGTHEFQSLSTDSITGLRDNQKDWLCSKPGVVWKPALGDPAMGRTSAQRLTRLRFIARQFALQMTEKDGSVDTLRLLSQPLYRYQCPTSNVIDGALFAFARGTDPEALLLLEVRDEDGKPKLFYALARSNFLPISASYGGEEIWKVERLDRARMKAGTEPYTKFIFRDAKVDANGTP